jgi:hypothetical protein
MKVLHFSEGPRRNVGFLCLNISLLLTFFLPRVKRKEIIKTQKPIAAVQKLGVAEEGTSMNDENKNKAGLTGIKGMGLFYFCGGDKGVLSPVDWL